MVNLLY